MARRLLAWLLALPLIIMAASVLAVPRITDEGMEEDAMADDGKVPVIAAAASIKFALDEVAAEFTRETGLTLKLAYGSSGNLVAQAQHGAPFELLLSADERYIALLGEAGLTQGPGVTYALGSLALVAAKDSPLAEDLSLEGLKRLLARGKLERFAIANPRHAPYGERARELLQRLGLWDQLQPTLVLGENVSQAAQFAISGSAQGGIIALSLAMTEEFGRRGNYLELPPELYGSLAQDMALLRGAGTSARRFFDYLQGDTARSIFARHGFILPQKPN